jgi:NADPH:quinone reductase-like Zn-dependent oxidoreductase
MNKEHYSGLDRLAVLATEGDMASFMDRPYPLTEAADAVRHLAAGKAAGKVVITV